MFAVMVLIGTGFALVPARGAQIYRFGFGGKNTALVRGHANVKVEEKEHNISDQSFKSQPTSEHLKLTADIAAGDAAYIHYHYATPPAPVSAVLSAGVWVKATKPGVQLRARVVFPKEPDPARPESPLTMLIVGDTYQKSRQWDKLTLTDVPALIGKHLPVLQTKIGRAVNSSGAYIDRLVLNVYTGPGTADIWIDDLDIGPVRVVEGEAGTPGVAVKRPGEIRGAPGRLSEYRPGQLLVDKKAFFFRAIRYTGTPLYVLRQAGFDALWVPTNVQQEILDEANREGWMLIPSAPVAPRRREAYPTSTRPANDAQADALTAYYRKFSGTDVLFWDLGGGRTAEMFAAVDQTKDLLRKLDPKRPVGGDVWDGFQAYSTSLEIIGAHRWPLFTSLELARYRDWLSQRNATHFEENRLLDVGAESLAGLVHRERAGTRPQRQVRRPDRPAAGAGSLADVHQPRVRLSGNRVLVGPLPRGQPLRPRPASGDGDSELRVGNALPSAHWPFRIVRSGSRPSDPNVKAALLRSQSRRDPPADLDGSRGRNTCPIRVPCRR